MSLRTGWQLFKIGATNRWLTARSGRAEEPGFWETAAKEYRAQVERANERTGELAQRNVDLAKQNVQLVQEVIRLTRIAKPDPIADDGADPAAPTTRDGDRHAMEEARKRTK